jgi:hypothetical protein
LLTTLLHEIKTRLHVSVPLAHSHAFLSIQLGKTYTDPASQKFLLTKNTNGFSLTPVSKVPSTRALLLLSSLSVVPATCHHGSHIRQGVSH